MRLYKVKITSTPANEVTKVNVALKGLVTVNAIYYSSQNPSSYLHLLDADKDEFMFPVPGTQPVEGGAVKPTTLNYPTTVRLPLYIVDETGNNDVIIWGVVEEEKLDEDEDKEYIDIG